MESREPPPHPDRTAPTLAVRDRLLAGAGDGPFAAPGPGSADARIDLKLLLHRARTAVAERPDPDGAAALRRIASPDLLAGTVQDGTARGVMVVLEEAISLCGVPLGRSEPPWVEPSNAEHEHAVTDGRALRRRKDLLVASGGARIRWSRRGGVLFVDRAFDVHAEDCLRFEDRSDRGDLDGFVPDLDERPRLFSPAFLRPRRYVEGSDYQRLELEGRLGRGPRGYPARIVFEGRRSDAFVTLGVAIRNDHDDHRLRLRVLGCRAPDSIARAGTPPFERVVSGARHFVTATLVRACGRLRVGAEVVAVPGAQCHGWHHHVFRLGGVPWS